MVHITTLHRGWTAAAGLLFAGLGAMPAVGAEPSLAPLQGWRYRPAVIRAEDGRVDLEALLRGESAEWAPAVKEDADPTWAFRVSQEAPRGPVMLTAEAKVPRPIRIFLEEAKKTGPEGGSEWSTLGQRQPNGRLQHFTFEPRPGAWYRMRIAIPNDANRPEQVRVTNVGLYDLSGPKRKDYWLVVGASIQAQSIRQSTFRDLARQRYPDADPVVFNLAVGGWKTNDLRAALPGFLRDHPHASYVCIHIGGNNVTPNRPYPGGAEQIREDIAAICREIQKAGKTPILARLSYRAYRGKRPVPPESNGSGPYVDRIYDPLIREFCPAFFDEKTGKGRVDAYEWFKAHPEELKPDGIHVTPEGEVSWNRLWVEHAGKVVYGVASDEWKK